MKTRTRTRPIITAAVCLLFACIGVSIAGEVTLAGKSEPGGTPAPPASNGSGNATPGSGRLPAGAARTPTPGPTAPAAPPSSTAAPGNPIKLMPLGDSITSGFMYPGYGGYRVLLWQKLVQQDHDNIDFVGSAVSGPAELGDRDNEGHDGWFIGPTGPNNLLAYIDEWLAKYKPDIILLHAGTNDLNFLVDGAVTSQRLDDLLEKIYTDLPNVKVIVAQPVKMRDPQPYPPKVANEATYHDAIPKLAAKHAAKGRNIQVVDMSQVLNADADYSDPLHPSVQGYNKMAEAWYPLVNKLYQNGKKR